MKKGLRLLALVLLAALLAWALNSCGPFVVEDNGVTVIAQRSFPAQADV